MPVDGHPRYAGHLVVFNFFLEKGWTREEILECPEYLAYCLMGAISKDHADLRMSETDQLQWRMGLELKRQREASSVRPRRN